MTLPGPGEYHIVPGRGSIPLLGSDRTATFEPGPNQLDWSIDGGRVVVELVNWDKSSPVTLQLNELEHELNRNTESEFSVQLSDPHPVVLDGIGFGGYRIKARQRRPEGDVLVSEAREFTIAENDPSEELELTLGRYDARLVLRTPGGSPVRSAEVLSPTLTSLEEVKPGVFVLSGDEVVPGEVIQIFAAGFAPTCRLAPKSGAEVVVVVNEGAPTLVKFTHPLATRPTDITRAPGRLIVPQAGCSVLLNRAEYVASGYEPDGTFLFYFPHFPRHPAPQFQWGGSLVTGARGADGVLRVLMPEKR